MRKAARNLSQRKQAWFRAALLILFVLEAAAFNQFVGPLDNPSCAGVIGVAALLVLPLAIGSFRRGLPVCAFYAAFLFTFAALIVIPSATAARANRALAGKCAKVKCALVHKDLTRQQGMTRPQVNAIFSGYEREDFPSLAEMLRKYGFKDWDELGCGNSYYSNSNFYAVTRGRFAHQKWAQVTYNWGGIAISCDFYDVPVENVPEAKNFAAVDSAVRAVRRFAGFCGGSQRIVPAIPR